MEAAGRRRGATAGAALVAAGVLVVAPMTAVAPWAPGGVSTVERAARLLADGESLLNIPINLFQDYVNIASNELQALTVSGNSLIFSGPWLAASATNIWGEDPGDPMHFMGVIDTLIPFRAISGLGEGEPNSEGLVGFNPADAADGHLGLGQQLTLLADLGAPVSASSDADWSAPLFPVSEITGSSLIDRILWSGAMVLGLQNFPLFQNWFQLPSDLFTNGTTFSDPGSNPGLVDPSLGPGDNQGVATDDVFGIAGTHPATAADYPNGLPEGYTVDPTTGDVLNANGNPVNLMPWEGLAYKPDLTYPFQNFLNSLEQTPDTSIGFGSNATYDDILDPSTGFQLPSLDELIIAGQTLLAGSLIAFDPWVTGSAIFCAGGPCDIPDQLQLPALVQDIYNVYPHNTYIEHWLNLVNMTPEEAAAQGYPTGPFPDAPSEDSGIANWDAPGPLGWANGPTWHQVAMSSMASQGPQQWFDFGNPSTDDPPSSVDTPIPFDTSPFMQDLITFAKDSGIQDFFQELANLSQFEPTDWDDPTVIFSDLTNFLGSLGF